MAEVRTVPMQTKKGLMQERTNSRVTSFHSLRGLVCEYYEENAMIPTKKCNFLNFNWKARACYGEIPCERSC